MRLAWECVKYRKLHARSSIMWTYQNDLGFNLYTTPSICCIVIISENWTESKVRISTDIGISPLNTRD